MLTITNLTKSIKSKPLYDRLELYISRGEKSALIGRNGTGKTTLFRIITGEDKDYEGLIKTDPGIKVISTKQEHHLSYDVTPLEYILEQVPEYYQLKKILFGDSPQILTNTESMTSTSDPSNTTTPAQANPNKSATTQSTPTQQKQTNKPINHDKYAEALEKFLQYDYYTVEDRILQALNAFQITEEQSIDSFMKLSGGEKRFVELVKIMFSGADLALIDEPTNHMDTEGKEMFVKWLHNTDKSCIIITHDRDVLKHVDTIYELNSQKIVKFKGNYDRYLKQNQHSNISAINDFEKTLNRAEELKSQIKRAERLAPKFIRMARLRDRLKKQYEETVDNLEKPEFWIDKESLTTASKTEIDKYEKYKSANIKISDKSNRANFNRLLFSVRNLSLGYTSPLFHELSFDLYESDRYRVLGRNGAGKTTFLNYLISEILEQPQKSTKFKGDIKITNSLKLGVYEQEPHSDYLKLTLYDAIAKVYLDLNDPLSKAQIISIIDTYLFDKSLHMDTPIEQLSGGEKARFQLIKMLANKPTLLILDEPTNHLDLPSIEQLESFLKSYHGAIIYVSHDSYFVNSVQGKEIRVTRIDS